jgi:hypothetical protein
LKTLRQSLDQAFKLPFSMRMTLRGIIPIGMIPGGMFAGGIIPMDIVPVGMIGGSHRIAGGFGMHAHGSWLKSPCALRGSGGTADLEKTVGPQIDRFPAHKARNTAIRHRKVG